MADMSNVEDDTADIQEDWELLVSFLPTNWQDLAAETEPLKGLRKNTSAENLLRMLLHLGCGYSLLETAVQAHQEGQAVAAGNPQVRQVRDRVHDLPGD